MSRGRSHAVPARSRVAFVLAALVAGALSWLATPAWSATQTIDVGNFYFGSPGTTVINATVGDQLRFVVSTGTSHDISVLGVSSGPINKDDPPFVVTLTQAGSFTIECTTHQAQGHSVQLEVAPAPTTTTTSPPATTTTTTTTTTAPPGGSTTTSTTTTTILGSTTTTTAPPGGSTTTSTPPGGTTTTLASEVSTTIAGGSPGGSTTTSAAPGTGPGVPGATGDDPDVGDQALGVTSPGIEDAGWVRPLWWTILGGSIVGLVWVAIAWRKRPTEYD